MALTMELEKESVELVAADDGRERERRSEAELIDRAKTDPEAFGQLYETYYPMILNYLYRRAHNIAIAEDLTSNTFFKALRALPGFQQRAPLRAWLYRIATNELMAFRRSQGRRRHHEQDLFGALKTDRIYFCRPQTEAAAEREELSRRYERLSHSLQTLPEPYQQALILRYFEGLSYEELSSVLGKRQSAIRSLISRGLKRLRISVERTESSARKESQDAPR